MDNNFKKECVECGGEVKKGYIQCGNRIAWVPEVSKASIEPSMNKDSILLSNQTRFSINHVDAYICEKCKKVVLDYSDLENE